ncbi:5716_t:CDS:2, partial [Ambispora gerdemannii]
MYNGWYINEREERCTQSIIFSDDYPVTRLRGQLKGIKRILEERNLWPAKKIRLVCERYSEKNNDNPEILNCCAWRIMSQQPDFCEHYNYKDLLKHVPEILVSVPITTTRKFSRKSWRYMDAYYKGLKGRTAEWAV